MEPTYTTYHKLGQFKEVKDGIAVDVLFFGSIALFFRGEFAAGFILAIAQFLSFVTLFASPTLFTLVGPCTIAYSLYMAFCANEWQAQRLRERGWQLY